MDDYKKWFGLAFPEGWADVVIRAVKVFIISMLVFHLKEYIDAGVFDTPDITIDSLWLAGGAVVLNAVLLFLKR